VRGGDGWLVLAASTLWLMGAPATSPAQTDAYVTIVRPRLATVVYDRRGGLLGEIGPEARTWVRLVELPAAVGQAFVATEDRRFYQHDGVDVIGVVGAIRDNLLQGFGARGASTITQQLVGAMYPERVDRRQISLARKIREAEMARALERRHGKAEILEAYLNYIPFGHGWYGVEAGARHYFGKHAADLTLAEAALLAAIPNSPGLYDPRAHPGRALRRRNLVLRRMEGERYLTSAAARGAMREPLRLARDDGFAARAPYVVEWVRQWLVDRYGLAAVNTGGLAVTTTVDPDLQRAASSSLAAGLARVESLPDYRWPRYDASAARPLGSSASYLQGLLIALDPSTGDVLALEGGRDFRDSEFNRAVQSRRQAGSAFKPFVYAAALAQGLPPTMLLDDSPLSLPGGNGTQWTPENSDGAWSGPVTMRTALVRSINIPAVRLALAAGLDSVVATAQRLGLTTQIPPVATTAIGAADVRPIELVAAYGVFATLGTYVTPRIVTLVQGSSGLPVYEAPAVQPAPVLDPRVAFQMVEMMGDVVLRGTGTAARRGLPAALPVAGKTGTTNDNADVWFVGLTPDFVAGVWMGFDRPRTITPLAFGGTLAAPIWAAFAASAYSVRPIPPAWQPPPGLVALRVRRSDGSPAPQDTTDATCTEYFLGGTEPAGRGAAERLLRRLRLALFGW
jgi:1A family penicillin-binding protein